VLLASFSLVLFPFALNRAVLEMLPPPWKLLTLCVEFFGSICLGLFFYLFPNGRFVPRWTSWLALGWIAYWGLDLFVPFFANLLLGLLSFVLFLGLIGSLVVVQVYHYRRVSTPVERQQTKWVVF